MRRNYKTSSIKSKCHKVLPASQRTTNHTTTPLFCLSCYLLLLFWNFGVFLTQCSALASTINPLTTGALLNYTPLKQFKNNCVAHSYLRSSRQTGKQTAGESGIVRWCRWRCRWRWWRPVSTGPRGNRGGWCEMMKGPKGDRHPSVRLGHNLHKN